jgi:DNA-directed RNA polymerase subunit K/omega
MKKTLSRRDPFKNGIKSYNTRRMDNTIYEQFMTKFEETSLIGVRMQQIANGARSSHEIVEKNNNPLQKQTNVQPLLDVIDKEIKSGSFPLKARRSMMDGSFKHVSF